MYQRFHVGKGDCPDDESAASSGRNRGNFFEKETQPHPELFSLTLFGVRCKNVGCLPGHREPSSLRNQFNRNPIRSLRVPWPLANNRPTEQLQLCTRNGR